MLIILSGLKPCFYIRQLVIKSLNGFLGCLLRVFLGIAIFERYFLLKYNLWLASVWINDSRLDHSCPLGNLIRDRYFTVLVYLHVLAARYLGPYEHRIRQLDIA
ncbi:hypothetical protein D3C80_1732560 [compost metagenome]